MEKLNIKIQQKTKKRHLDYLIYLRKGPLENNEQDKKVGEIIRKDTQEVVADIVVNDKSVEAANFRTMYVMYFREKQRHVICMTAAQFKDFLPRTPEVLFSLWHELGHIHNGDLVDGNGLLNTQQDRNTAVFSGTVCEKERKADAFAAGQVGKAVAVLALQKMKAERKMRDICNGTDKREKAKLALMEYDYRIKAIQELG